MYSGHDKGNSITRVVSTLGDNYKTVFIGDGISDITGARKADFLFAKKNLNLEKWCLREKYPLFRFSNFFFLIFLTLF